MSLVPYDPFRQLSNMRREFDRFFSELPISFDNEHGIGGIRVDVHETENEVVATCDLPGLEKKEDVDIDIQNNRLSISGSIKRTNEIKEENMLKKERYTGRFQRMITLPSPVSHDGVKATYKNGILEITMPKVAKDVKKKIDVSFQ
ncbi:Hsp20/alpha crystallin family protein [Bacillus subtilis]|uniref:Acid shock protein n=3 Tax=Bacillaceae TaxID=186817 RepID=A0A1X9MDP6_9BACI|nr:MULTISPECIES: Hsp20/alpha crystallin family protein [Bacilli]AAD22620.1 stress response homolog Hsp [Bacillus subtilis]AAZ73229.1 Hsp [Bacillus subtilis]ARK29671.1 Acid shock protein [Halalkalibacter krulwichiae]ATI23357.1 Hsp20/alpha crystallin family protein [Bacillus subtilis]AWM63472.1 hsp protein [Bacillus amyloliquefaciens]